MLDAAVLDALDHACNQRRLRGFGKSRHQGPSSTWTYLVNDDPFRDQIAGC